MRIVLALATFVAFASQTTRAETYACNDRHYVKFLRPRSSLPVLGKPTLSPRGDLLRR